jgi:cholera toxin transcriptional activator
VSSSSFRADRGATARFGAFEADVETRELRKQGHKLPLQEQPFAVLVALVERAGSVVTREELRERIWAGDTFVDFDHSLNTAVNKLRQVLGDSATHPRFIETLSRRGYRFLGDVQWQQSREAPAARGSALAGVADSPSEASDLPQPHRGITRSLFVLIQMMYLVFYIEAMLHWQGIDRIAWVGSGATILLVLILVTAAVGIPLRCYLFNAAAFDYRPLGDKFGRIYPAVLLLDELWAIAPFLIVDRIGFGAAFAATAGLLYVPFAERTLIRMAYGKA